MMFRLSEEQRAFVGNVRKLAQTEFRARAPKYMDGSFPWENIRKLADLGILGMAVPQDYGGSGMGVLDTALVLEEIAKVCYVTAMAVLGEVGIAAPIFGRHGTVVGGIGVAGPRERLNGRVREAAVATAVGEAARSISRDLGAQRWPPS